jgi:5-methylcytosine-specific restriction endonuclease McrA
MVPFTIRLVDRRVEDSVVQPVRLKLDPGSKTTGVALVREPEATDEATGETLRAVTVLWLAELQHRGHAIRDALTQRRAFRRRRRGNLRYRPARFDNRTKPAGWLAPSLRHRVDTTLAWVERLRRWAPVTGLATMLHRFDTQLLQNPDISGVAYQQGTLAGYEVREYLLEKWKRRCAYCDAAEVPLSIDHVHPKAKGGSDRISNLVLACLPCNQRKNAQDVRAFLAHDPERLARIEEQRKVPLADAAAVSSTRWALYGRLKATGLTVEVGSGGRTKWNRSRQGYPKAHWIDAACVGLSGVTLQLNPEMRPFAIRATGHGNRQMCGTNRYGFPIRHRSRARAHFGFQTGDMVRAVVRNGKKAGRYMGRVLCRKSGSFDIQTASRRITGISHRHCLPVHRQDGYGYGL